jgi:hypothetical protein
MGGRAEPHHARPARCGGQETCPPGARRHRTRAPCRTPTAWRTLRFDAPHDVQRARPRREGRGERDPRRVTHPRHGSWTPESRTLRRTRLSGSTFVLRPPTAPGSRRWPTPEPSSHGRAQLREHAVPRRHANMGACRGPAPPSA